MAGDFGKALLGGIAVAITWKSLSPKTKEGISRLLGEALEDWDRQKSQAEIKPQPPQVSLAPPTFKFVPPETVEPPRIAIEPPTPKLPDQPAIDRDAAWLNLIPEPSITVILGKRGAGKSALGYRLLEKLRGRRAPYVVGVPEAAAKKLPEWIGVAESLDEVPPGSVALIDEAYIHFHARNSQTQANKDLSQLLNLSRQRDQTLIFITQESRQVDKNIVSAANVVIFKEPSALQVEFERPEVRKIAERAAAEFSGVSTDRRGWSYVFSPESDHAGLERNELPSFWTPSLSKSFGKSAGGSAKPRTGKKLSIEERRAKTRELRAEGWSLSQIAGELHVSKGTVVNDLKSDE